MFNRPRQRQLRNRVHSGLWDVCEVTLSRGARAQELSVLGGAHRRIRPDPTTTTGSFDCRKMGGWTAQKDSSSLYMDGWMVGDGGHPKRTLNPPHLPPAEAARLNRGLSGRLSAEAADLEVSWRNRLSRRRPPGQPAVLLRVSTRQSFWNNAHKDEDTGGQGKGQHPTPTYLAHVAATELPSLPFLHVAQRCTHTHALDVHKFQPWLRRCASTRGS
ncbi:hypothetical protein S40285_10431 [Stachybotrys chlorohalonatus IBT 40285]|uniref:Uncharacterized protein n=1 Tax=Stachybotrys chlorohalonatus (strain IBT 40285) TaxID=1283841 RepID=A0A084QHJ1_STAC4|nr:hypothetical protein S40285_10431 [Stachybotrys chlorohalonata IBT 40285]